MVGARIDWVILLTAGASCVISLIGLITAVISLMATMKATRAAVRAQVEAKAETVILKHEVNSRLTEMLELARQLGHQQGADEERRRKEVK